MKDDLIYRLRKRAEIRKQIQTRKSVQEGKPDRIAELLEEAAIALEEMIADKESPRCGNCHKRKHEHETWEATGEFAPYSVCPSTDLDEQGRYKKLEWFRPMTNLDYLEYESKNREA